VTSIERTAYPRFKRYFTPKELAEIYTPSQSEIAFAYATTQGTSHIFNLIVLLKSFQRLGYFPKLSDISNPLVNHIRGCLKLPPEIVLGYENLKTMYRHRSAIREYLKVKAFDKIARHLVAEAKALSASEMKAITLPKRLTLLLCLIYSAQVQTRDNLVEMFIKRMRSM